MRTGLKRTPTLIVCAALLFVLSSCGTLDYRQVQRDFQAAVQADNSGDPFSAGHDQIVGALTPEYIRSLDPRLQPNAWMLRAVSSWRSGSYSNAIVGAEQGKLAAKAVAEEGRFAGSRDDVLLEMIPALVADAEQTSRLTRRAPVPLSAEEYKPFGAAYRTALQQMNDAAGRFTGNTPDDVLAYYYYQRWRLLQHWTAAIGSMTDGSAIPDALGDAERALGKPLEASIKEARDRVPAGHALRALIRAQGGQ
jgi:hypothetical protein